MRILTSEQMQAADRHAIGEIGIPSLVLMESAGAEVLRVIEATFGEARDLTVLVLCGPGNNGGDGMVVARRLHGRGADVVVHLLGDPEKLSVDASHQWEILERLRVPTIVSTEEEWTSEAAHIEDYDVIVDAIFGTGFRGPLSDLTHTVLADLVLADIPVVSIDVPSGLSGSSASLDGPSVEATITVALQVLKICHVFEPARALCGNVVVADIGIPVSSLNAGGAALRLIEESVVAEMLLPLAQRSADTHKGDFGHVLVVGGSLSHSGAVALAGLGALRGGAGLVTVASPAPCVPIIASHAPELMHVALPATPAGEIADDAIDIEALLHRKTVVVAGPGMGTGPGAARLLQAILDAANVPVILDADALNLLAMHGLPDTRDERPLVVTPHPGELARLGRGIGFAEEDDAEDQVARLPLARELAQRIDGVVVLKGFRSMVVEVPDPALIGIVTQELVHVGSTGNPGMATGGTGDVLAGILGALLAQGLPPRDAAMAATHLHGLAGDLAEEELGQMSLAASDLVRYLPAAVASILSQDDDDDEGDDD